MQYKRMCRSSTPANLNKMSATGPCRSDRFFCASTVILVPHLDRPSSDNLDSYFALCGKPEHLSDYLY